MSEICQGWNATDAATPRQAAEPVTRYSVDVTRVQHTNGPVVWRQIGAGTEAEFWCWSRKLKRWVGRKFGPDPDWPRVSWSEAAWINAARGEHVLESIERKPKETEI